MGKEEVERIKKIFEDLELNPEYLEHEEVVTSEEAARLRGFELKQGVKAIIFTNGEEFVVVDVPGDKKVDVGKVAYELGWSKSKMRMATTEEVLKISGCVIGGVPPFGHKNKIKILVDKGIFDNEESDFNIGLRDKSVKIKTRELKVVFDGVGAKVGDFVR